MHDFPLNLCSNGRKFSGWFLLVIVSFSHVGFVYAAAISKVLPPSSNAFVSAIQNDRYYCFLVPLALPVVFVDAYFHWLGMKLFKNA